MIIEILFADVLYAGSLAIVYIFLNNEKFRTRNMTSIYRLIYAINMLLISIKLFL